MIEFFPEKNIILQIGALKFYFYGAMYALSPIVGYFLIKFFLPKGGLKITPDNIIDIIFWTMIAGVLGGRIFYVLVYNFPFFIDNPLQIFAVWKGGMSIHGGLIGGAIGFISICKKLKINIWQMADIIVPALAVGLILGRLANFMNDELYGRVTDSILGMDFGDGENRHPSQLYAMGKDLLLFIGGSFLLLKNYFKQNPGTVFSLFLISYGVLRFILEFFREPDPQIGLFLDFFSMGQILSLGVVLVGAFIFLFLSKKQN